MSEANAQATQTAAELEAPQFVKGAAKLIAGLRIRYTGQTMGNIPAQWQKFVSHLGSITGQIGQDTYGLCFGASNPEGIEYLTGVEVSSDSGLPAGFDVARIPAQKYAVFVHRGHVSQLWSTLDLIGREWRPEWGRKPAATAETADFFERYTEAFDPRTGVGAVEIWVPVQL